MMKQITSLILLFSTFLTSLGGVIPAVVKIYDENEIKEYEDAGVEILRRRGDIILCYFPDTGEDQVIITNGQNPDEKSTRSDESSYYYDRTEKKRREILLKQRGRISRPTLDQAVQYFSAANIQNGQGFESPYTGKGIIVGMCDIGFDPLHPTFLDENGKSRVKRITQYKEYEGERIVLEGDEAYRDWMTDSVEEFHATHVAGILGGGGAGSPYMGIARDADIVASVCCLTDFGLLMGVEDIIDYAKEEGKPVVINMSMGNYVGAHDGTSLFSQYLEMCSEDAILVLSAGNEGNNTNTLTHSFSNSEKLEFRLGSRDWSQKKMYGMTDIWNVSDNPLKVTVCIYDDESHEVVYEYEPQILQDWMSVRFDWNPENPIVEGLTLDGYLTLIGGVDPENGRYEVALMYDFESTRLIGSGWAKDMICVRIEGEKGDEIDIFADGSHTRLMAIGGQPSPDSHMSISDLVCGQGVISVGMYTNRETYPQTVFNEAGEAVDTEMKSFGETFQTDIHSSYGTLRDGRILPLTVAPGNMLVSSYSRHYRDSHPDEKYYLDDNGVSWKAMGGTSMASPFVAGYIATWLEAVPGLRFEDVEEMIEASNRHDIPDPADPRSINGFFNPVGALRYALDKNGITQIENPGLILLPQDLVEIYSLSGLKVYSGRADGCEGLSKGIYLVKTPYGVIKKVLPGLF